MKIKALSIGLLTAVLASGIVAPVFAQAGATQEQAQELLQKVGPAVWGARLTSEHNPQMLQAYKAGEAAYFKGDYDKAVRKLKAAQALTESSPNNPGGGHE
jgi:hypothetical protein